jgi:purine-cytosine permease-like protein
MMVLGAAIGGAVPNNPTWNAMYEEYSVGGVLAAMLSSAGGFGRFIVVILAFSVLGNIAASLYSITLNFQILLPVLLKVPRAVFAIVITAVVIPVSIKAASTFFAALENFIGVIGYWSAAFVAVVVTEHIVFRKQDCSSYDHMSWNVRSALPTGIAGIGAGALSFGLIIPCMSQIWYVGPIAETTGDIGFEVAFFLTALLYLPFRALEIKLRGRV